MGARRSPKQPLKRKRGGQDRPAVPAMPAGAGVAGPADDTLNPSLEGVEARDGRDARRKQERSVEDPLQDWPEDAAADRDDWLLDRDTERADP